MMRGESSSGAIDREVSNAGRARADMSVPSLSNIASAARGIASEVEDRRWPVRNPVLEVEPRPLHAVDPAAGRRLNDGFTVTCEAMPLTRRV